MHTWPVVPTPSAFLTFYLPRGEYFLTYILLYTAKEQWSQELWTESSGTLNQNKSFLSCSCQPLCPNNNKPNIVSHILFLLVLEHSAKVTSWLLMVAGYVRDQKICFSSVVYIMNELNMIEHSSSSYLEFNNSIAMSNKSLKVGGFPPHIWMSVEPGQNKTFTYARDFISSSNKCNFPRNWCEHMQSIFTQ